MKQILITSFLLLSGSLASAQSISQDMLSRLRKKGELTPTERAIRNGLASNDIRTFAVNSDNQGEQYTYFSNSVPSKGITDQKSSGRCWLFTGLNVLRAQMILIPEFVVEFLDYRRLQFGKAVVAKTGDDVVVDDVRITGSCTELYI